MSKQWDCRTAQVGRVLAQPNRLEIMQQIALQSDAEKRLL